MVSIFNGVGGMSGKGGKESASFLTRMFNRGKAKDAKLPELSKSGAIMDKSNLVNGSTEIGEQYDPPNQVLDVFVDAMTRQILFYRSLELAERQNRAAYGLQISLCDELQRSIPEMKIDTMSEDELKTKVATFLKDSSPKDRALRIGIAQKIVSWEQATIQMASGVMFDADSHVREKTAHIHNVKFGKLDDGRMVLLSEDPGVGLIKETGHLVKRMLNGKVSAPFATAIPAALAAGGIGSFIPGVGTIVGMAAGAAAGAVAGAGYAQSEGARSRHADAVAATANVPYGKSLQDHRIHDWTQYRMYMSNGYDKKTGELRLWSGAPLNDAQKRYMKREYGDVTQPLSADETGKLVVRLGKLADARSLYERGLGRAPHDVRVNLISRDPIRGISYAVREERVFHKGDEVHGANIFEQILHNVNRHLNTLKANNTKALEKARETKSTASAVSQWSAQVDALKKASKSIKLLEADKKTLEVQKNIGEQTKNKLEEFQKKLRDKTAKNDKRGDSEIHMVQAQLTRLNDATIAKEKLDSAKTDCATAQARYTNAQSTYSTALQASPSNNTNIANAHSEFQQASASYTVAINALNAAQGTYDSFFHPGQNQIALGNSTEMIRKYFDAYVTALEESETADREFARYITSNATLLTPIFPTQAQLINVTDADIQGVIDKYEKQIGEFTAKITELTGKIDAGGEVDQWVQHRIDQYALYGELMMGAGEGGNPTAEGVRTAKDAQENRLRQMEVGDIPFEPEDQLVNALGYPKVYLRALQLLGGEELLRADGRALLEKWMRLLPPPEFAAILQDLHMTTYQLSPFYGTDLQNELMNLQVDSADRRLIEEIRKKLTRSVRQGVFGIISNPAYQSRIRELQMISKGQLDYQTYGTPPATHDVWFIQNQPPKKYYAYRDENDLAIYLSEDTTISQRMINTLNLTTDSDKRIYLKKHAQYIISERKKVL